MQSTATIATRPKIAPSGAEPPGSGVQNSRPATSPRVPPMTSGIDQSKTFVRTSGSLTCGGHVLAIQCMRWSCHSKRPVRSTVFHFGVDLPVMPFGTCTSAKRSSLR